MNRFDALRRQAWPIVCTVLLLFFGATRLYDISSRPLHHDEGVNGIFMKNLIQTGVWKYDPKNYHGPTLYYLQLVPTWIASYFNDGAASFNPKSISGLTTVSIRLTIAFAGILLLWLVLSCWPMLGRLGAAAACILVGMSCDILFVSRYFIHETYMLVFTVMAVSSAHRYRQTKEPFYAYIAAVGATLMFATKETTVFHFLVLILALACAKATKWLADGRVEPLSWRDAQAAPRRVINGLGQHAPIIFTICIVIWALLFSSFLTNWKGPFDSTRSFFIWGAEGVESGHVKNFFYYFTDIILRYETVVVIFGFVGILAAFIRADLKGLFLAYWTLGMCGAYSLIPYKTPWLVIQLVLPMAFSAGYGVQTIYDEVRARLPLVRARVVLAAFAGVGLFLIIAEGRQTFRVNYHEYDKDKHPQVYAHTTRDVNDIMAKIDAAASRAGGKKMVINVFTDIYWPMPLYLVQYPNARFWGGNPADCKDPDAPVLLVMPKLQPELDARLKDIYSIKTINLRPGIPMALYTNTNLTNPQGVVTRTLDLLVSQPRPEGARSGLRMEAFKGVGFAGKPLRVVNGETAYDFNWETDGDKKWEAPFSLRWTGYMNIERAGLYKVALESDDGSWLTIDDTPIIDNGGDHPVIKMSRTVNLSAGYHKFELKYFDTMGGAVLHFTWAPPGSGEVPVPGLNFVYTPQ